MLLSSLMLPFVAATSLACGPFPTNAYAAATAASLMIGWTCLLTWADRRPFERSCPGETPCLMSHVMGALETIVFVRFISISRY